MRFVRAVGTAVVGWSLFMPVHFLKPSARSLKTTTGFLGPLRTDHQDQADS